MSKEVTVRGGIGLPALLGVVFIVLRLCNIINWSWWWVLAPFWIPLALAIVIILIVVVIAAATGRTDILDDYDY